MLMLPTIALVLTRRGGGNAGKGLTPPRLAPADARFACGAYITAPGIRWTWLGLRSPQARPHHPVSGRAAQLAPYQTRLSCRSCSAVRGHRRPTSSATGDDPGRRSLPQGLDPIPLFRDRWLWSQWRVHSGPGGRLPVGADYGSRDFDQCGNMREHVGV
jgi:hypothetical protein